MNDSILDRIIYLVGSSDIVAGMSDVPAVEPFTDEILGYLASVSKILMGDKMSRQYPDVVTFGFWIREASLKQLKERYGFKDDGIHFGRGVAFHIAPSNVPVNFAYSLVAGLLTGNANVVRVPSKDFEQVGLIADAFEEAFNDHPEMKPYVALIRYERESAINDYLSSIADTRIIWGGDQTIAEIRKSPLPPRSTEITFADRYSLAVIDSDVYLEIEDRKRVASDFYNDTYLSDQNACTSPRLVVWTGSRRDEAKEAFWSELHTLVKERYDYQDIQGVNKLTTAYIVAAEYGQSDVEMDGQADTADGVSAQESVAGAVDAHLHILPHEDNLLVRIAVDHPTAKLMDYMDNSGYFYEYNCDDIISLKEMCDDKRCQTVGIIGSSEMLKPLIISGVKGIDRVVPVGRTMDFDLIWDGYDLVHSLTRQVSF